MKAQNERETLQAWQRDRAEKDSLVFRQLEERQVFQRDFRAQRSIAQEDLLRLREDIERYRNLDFRHTRERESDDVTRAEIHRRTRGHRQRHRRDFEP